MENQLVKLPAEVEQLAQIDCISMPELSSREATEIANNARGLLDKVVAYINSNAAAL